MLVTKIAATIAVVAFLLAFVAARADSPFPNVITKWTYICGGAFIVAVASAIFALVALIWGL